METLIISLLIWLGAHTDYALPTSKNELPKIEYRTAEELKILVFDNADAGSKTVEAAFDEKTNTIYLNHNFNPKNIRDKRSLVHELTHFLQTYNKMKFECRGIAEREAFRVANRWYLQAGGMTDPDYELMILFVAAPCFK